MSKEYRSRYYHGLKLYMDNLERVVEQFARVSPKFLIVADDRDFQSFEELSRIRQKTIKALKIFVTEKEMYFSLELTEKSSGKLNCYEPAPSSFETIDELLKRNQRKIPKIITAILCVLLIPPYLLIAITWCYFIHLKNGGTIPFEIPSAFREVVAGPLGEFVHQNLILTFWGLFSGGLMLFSLDEIHSFLQRRCQVIYGTYRIDTPSFWERNWDKIAVGAILALVGLLLTFLNKYLSGTK
jgi:hypothetical protein